MHIVQDLLTNHLSKAAFQTIITFLKTNKQNSLLELNIWSEDYWFYTWKFLVFRLTGVTGRCSFFFFLNLELGFFLFQRRFSSCFLGLNIWSISSLCTWEYFLSNEVISLLIPVSTYATLLIQCWVLAAEYWALSFCHIALELVRRKCC